MKFISIFLLAGAIFRFQIAHASDPGDGQQYGLFIENPFNASHVGKIVKVDSVRPLDQAWVVHRSGEEKKVTPKYENFRPLQLDSTSELLIIFEADRTQARVVIAKKFLTWPPSAQWSGGYLTSEWEIVQPGSATSPVYIFELAKTLKELREEGMSVRASNDVLYALRDKSVRIDYSPFQAAAFEVLSAAMGTFPCDLLNHSPRSGWGMTFDRPQGLPSYRRR
ncbi:MAG: hypothetical protein C5B49_13400 [Bdellovibrio sp.]|nr:MAG: hypothetical protein C5B49_13400 [Bdellovibrio sp.]